MQTQTVLKLFGAGLLSASLVAGCTAADDDFATDDIGSSYAPLLGADSPDAIPGEYIVVFKQQMGAQSVNAAMNRISLRSFDSRVTNQYSLIPGFSATLSDGDLDSIRQNPDVAYVEANQVMYTTATKPSNGNLELARHDQCPAADDGVFDDHGCDGAGVRMYIVDSGVRGSHNEFSGRMAAGFTAINDGNGTNDCDGHGTHVASTAAGTQFGMASRATIIPVRVLDCNGSGSFAGVIAGVDFVRNDCRGRLCVANMSLGGPASAAVDQAVANLVSSGVPVAVAAGNNATDAINNSPAREPSAITVGNASDSGYPATAGSNSVTKRFDSAFGSRVDIWASGTSILGAGIRNDSDTLTISGTSMASPHVAGAIAQMLSCQGALSPAQVAAELDDKAIPNAMADERGAEDLFLCSDFRSGSSDGACDCGGGGGPNPNSCVESNACGRFDASRPCQCDSECARFGDCCSDVNAC